MKRCFIISAGSFYGLPVKPETGDFIIAADAGLKNCVSAGLKPDLLLGDFDSMAKPADMDAEVWPVEKDDTDTMLAIRRGLALGYTEFHILGAMGGARPDHSLANLQSLLFLAEHEAQGYIYDKAYTFTAIKNTAFTLKQPFYDAILSVFCFGTDAVGVTITGTKYNVSEVTVSAGFPIGVSNHVLEPEATVSVKNGSLVLCWERERSEKA